MAAATKTKPEMNFAALVEDLAAHVDEARNFATSIDNHTEYHEGRPAFESTLADLRVLEDLLRDATKLAQQAREKLVKQAKEDF